MGRATCTVFVAASAMLLASAGPGAAAFTGPTSEYYLDQAAASGPSTIYVVQGSKVVRSFATNTSTAPFGEGNLAVTDVITTNGWGSAVGLGSAGQYTLTGTPTGVAHTAQATPGYSSEVTFDGTSDGQHNYTVQDYSGSNRSPGAVIQTDLNWQNPVVLFSATGFPFDSDGSGVGYDPYNNSIWISVSNNGVFENYSLSGTLLSSFRTGITGGQALGYDAADNTLWSSIDGLGILVQYSTSGIFLQSGTPDGLPYQLNLLAGDFATEVPEPMSLTVLGAGLASLGIIRRRKVPRSTF